MLSSSEFDVPVKHIKNIALYIKLIIFLHIHESIVLES